MGLLSSVTNRVTYDLRLTTQHGSRARPAGESLDSHLEKGTTGRSEKKCGGKHPHIRSADPGGPTTQHEKLPRRSGLVNTGRDAEIRHHAPVRSAGGAMTVEQRPMMRATPG